MEGGDDNIKVLLSDVTEAAGRHEVRSRVFYILCQNCSPPGPKAMGWRK